MRFEIVRIDDDNIMTNSDFSDVKDKGEIAHFIAELECLKQELLVMWESWREG